MKLEGTRALVTGGSRGIGLAIGLALRDAGAEVLVCARSDRGLARARTLGLETVVCDVVRADASQVLARAANTLDLLVHNAGIQRYPDYAASPWPDPGPEIELNLLAPMRITSGLMPLLRQSEAPTIVNVTSVLALAPKQSAPVYCTSKAGLRAWTKALRAQLAPAVQVVELIPPLVATEMTEGRQDGAVSPEVVAEALVRGLLAGREEIRVAKARLLFALHRVSPTWAESMLRHR